MMMPSPAAAQRVKTPRTSARLPNGSTMERNFKTFSRTTDMPSGGADQKGHFAEPAYRKIAATTKRNTSSAVSCTLVYGCILPTPAPGPTLSNIDALLLEFPLSCSSKRLSNGSRLSCGRLVRRRKGVERQSVPARAQHSASFKAITARQLQALVRLRHRSAKDRLTPSRSHARRGKRHC